MNVIWDSTVEIDGSSPITLHQDTITIIVILLLQLSIEKKNGNPSLNDQIKSDSCKPDELGIIIIYCQVYAISDLLISHLG
jgi:hypothetical protein